MSFRLWLLLMAFEVALCMALALASAQVGYAGAPFVWTAWVITGFGAASIVALLVFRAVVWAGTVIARHRTRPTVWPPHGAD
jgi:H+/gluconate symporter-like permease